MTSRMQYKQGILLWPGSFWGATSVSSMGRAVPGQVEALPRKEEELTGSEEILVVTE